MLRRGALTALGGGVISHREPPRVLGIAPCSPYACAVRPPRLPACPCLVAVVLSYLLRDAALVWASEREQAEAGHRELRIRLEIGVTRPLGSRGPGWRSGPGPAYNTDELGPTIRLSPGNWRIGHRHRLLFNVRFE